MIATADKSYLKMSSAAVLGILLSLFGANAKASTAVPEQEEITESSAADLPHQTSSASLSAHDLGSMPEDIATESSSGSVGSIVSAQLSESTQSAASPAVPVSPFQSQLMQSDSPHQSFDSLLPSAQFSDVVYRSVDGDTAMTPSVATLADKTISIAQPLSPQLESDSEIAQSVDDTFAPLSDEDIRQQLLIDPTLDPAEIRSGDALDRPRAVPSSNFLTPSAYGADWGDAYVGVAGATVDNDREVDGSASIGIGLGNAVNNVGLEVSTSIISLDGFAEDGIVGFKLHKVFPRANNLAIAAGWSNPIKWGAAQNAEDTFYGVVTQQYKLRPGKENTVPLTASLGVGTGAFRSTGAIEADDNAPNVFGSLGLRVIPKVSVNTSWTGSALGLALSAAPFQTPLVVTAGVADLTDNTDNGTQFVGSVGYSFSF